VDKLCRPQSRWAFVEVYLLLVTEPSLVLTTQEWLGALGKNLI
jgi:hypothetical protein